MKTVKFLSRGTFRELSRDVLCDRDKIEGPGSFSDTQGLLISIISYALVK